MELLYIYIDGYKSLTNQNINFGGSFRFFFEKATLKLTAVKNDSYVANFYNLNDSNETIVNVSSIIGENGTGKSSILHFIKDNFIRGKNLEYPVVFVTKIDGRYKVFTTFEGIVIEGANFEVELIINPTKDEKIFNFGYDFRGLPSTDIIFFSNIFDGTPGGTLGGLYDISTNGLIYEDYNHNVLQRIINTEEDHVAVFLTEDVYRQLVLITSDISRDLFPFKLPKTLTIGIHEVLNSFDKNSSEHVEFDKLKKAIKEHYVAEYLRTDDFSIVEDLRNIHVNYLIAAILESLIRELLQVQSQAKSLDFKFTSEFILNDDKLVQYIPFKDRINYFFEQVISQVKESKVIITNLNELVENNRIFINFILENAQNFYNFNIDHRSPSAYINIYAGNDSNELLLKEFMHLYRKTFSINQYFKFSWRNLSTGENALLNIFARFYSLSDTAKIAGHLENNIIILIDEGDTYLHPAWQKGLLKNLLEFLPICFHRQNGKNRKIQLILTTNSAIPASDFLTANTVFFQKKWDDRGNYRTSIKDSLNEQKATFAANIHTLLSDSFFISNGLRGEFANFKINEIIGFLKGEGDTNLSEKDILVVIDQIGEPMIKNSLRELYFKRFPGNIDAEIGRLIELKKQYGTDK